MKTLLSVGYGFLLAVGTVLAIVIIIVRHGHG